MLSVKSISILTAISILSTTRCHGKIATTNGQIPWAVYIIANYDATTNNLGEWNCTGAIITESRVITSGDCAAGSIKFRVRIGPHYSGGEFGPYDAGNITGKNLDFAYDAVVRREASLSNDARLALLKLQQPCTFGPYVNKVNLSSWAVGREVSFLNATLGYVIGYAVNQKNNLELQYYSYFLKDIEICRILFAPQPQGFLTNEKFCAEDDQGKYRNLCSPKSFGAALIGEERTLIGIAIEECVEGGPQKFARISFYKEWIDSVLAADSIISRNNRTQT